MAVYTVHEPLPKRDEAAADPERFAFVRDGFYFWAFVFGPLWMLWRRLWLVTLLYFALSTSLQLALWTIGATGTMKFALWFLLALLVGFEAGTLRRWTLTRHGWRNLGVVVGDDLESAERRFFAAWTPPMRQDETPPPAPAPAPGHFRRPGDGQIIGLFPQPGARR